MIASSFDFAHSIIARTNRGPDGDATIFATVILATLFVPSLIAIFGAVAGALPSEPEAWVISPIAVVPAVMYVAIRRRKLAELRSILPQVLPQRTRLTGAVFLLIAIIGSALVAKLGWWQSPALVLLTAMLPWARWGHPGAP